MPYIIVKSKKGGDGYRVRTKDKVNGVYVYMSGHAIPRENAEKQLKALEINYKY